MFRISHTARGIVAVAAIAVSALALSACSGSGDGGGSGGAADTSRLTIGVDTDMATGGYDPIRGSVNQRMFWEGVYDSLFVIDEQGQVVPQLVTSFSFNDDSTQMTLDLDTSATFEDGSTLDAELVKQNLDARSQSELNAYDQFGEGQENEITDVTVVDEDTVTLTFAQPRPGFEANLTAPSGFIVGPTGAADRSTLATATDGSGPLTMDTDETVKANKYVQVKKENYTGDDPYPFDSYEFRTILDPQARVNAVISGEVDLASLTSESAPQVESAGTGLVANGGTIVNLISFDKSGALAPEWGDPRVYQALSMAIDREAFVAGVHPGEVPTANALPEDSPGFLPELDEQYAYDPEGAKALLAEAGYADGFSFEFVISPTSQRDMEAIQPYWAAIGVDVTLKNASSTQEQYLSVQNTPMGGPLPMTWTNPLGNVFGVLFGFANYHNAKNEAIQSAAGAFGAAQGSGDEDAEAATLADLNRAIVDSGWLIPLYEQLSPWGYNTAVLQKPTFPGAEASPILSTLTPAS